MSHTVMHNKVKREKQTIIWVTNSILLVDFPPEFCKMQKMLKII